MCGLMQQQARHAQVLEPDDVVIVQLEDWQLILEAGENTYHRCSSGISTELRCLS
jgi:hypothetical protein